MGSEVTTEPARLASWIMRDAPPGARRLLYVAAEGHDYETGSGYLAEWLAGIAPANLKVFIDTATAYGFPREFDALTDWLASNGWSYGLTVAEVAHRGTVHVADATRYGPFPAVELVRQGRSALEALRALQAACAEGR